MRFILLAALALPPALQDEADARIKEFTEAMKASKSDADRVAAIRTFSRTRHLKTSQKLTQVVAGPYADDVKIAAADAIGRIGDPRIGPSLTSILNTYGMLLASENPKAGTQQDVAEAVVRALGSCRDRSCVPRLVQILTKNNIPLIAQSVRTLAMIRDASSVDQLVRLHYAALSPELGAAVNPRKPLAPDTLAALRRITGQKLTTADEWTGWWRTHKAGFAVPPEESVGGLPPDVRSWALYSGQGEAETLQKFGLVILDPGSYAKEDLAEMKAIALSGDPQAALDKGFAGFVTSAEQAAEMRKKFPKALLVARGDPARAAPFVNALLVEGLDPRKPDEKTMADLKEARYRHDAAILALFVTDKAGEIQDATRFCRDAGFLLYAAPDAEYSKIGPLPTP
jgi:hypothetical protein